jgi:uncharacterized protein YggU (UPF0235/DUF167 family)
MRLVVVAHPRARQDRVEVIAEGSLAVWVRAVPVDGAANAAIERAVARALGLRAAQIQVVGGHGSRRKTVAIDALSQAELRERLRALGDRSS